MARRLLLWLVSITLVGNAGCTCCEQWKRRHSAPPPCPPGPPGRVILPPPPGPISGPPPGSSFSPPPGASFAPPQGYVPSQPPPGASFSPPQGFPTNPQQQPPPQGAFPTAPPAAPATAPSMQTPPPPQQSLPPQNSLPPKTETRWQPVEGREQPPQIKLYAPEPLFGDTTPKDTDAPPQVTPRRETEPEPAVEKTKVMTTLPVGIPSFGQVKDNLWTGYRPTLDGLDWLQASGCRTVVYLRQPGEMEAIDRKQFEKRGIAFLSLEISPQTVTKAKIDEFQTMIKTMGNQPIFVYDRDGSIAGPMWYLYYRFTENHADDVAQIRARSLGLQMDGQGAHREMWLAVQKYLADTNP
jgi:protein tyrosine phosphatase (PTP) superfamily phosphohydrolase (DUF442 family)